MRHLCRLLALVLPALGPGCAVPPSKPAAAGAALEVALVDAMQAAGGTRGTRVVHGKGLCLGGEFAATGDAARITIAASLAPGFRAPVEARLSIASADPRIGDHARQAAVRGLAFAIDPPGEAADFNLAMNNTPVADAATAESFLALFRAAAPDPATGAFEPQRFAAARAAHPDWESRIAWTAANPPSDSHATTAFWGIHSFLMTDAAGVTRAVRWHAEPAAGRASLPEAQRRALGPDHLEADLRRRLAAGPVAWRLMLTLAEPGDPIEDPTLAWPATRPALHGGTLTLTRIAPPGVAGACDAMQFSPLVLPRGIAPSADSVLRMRGGSYRLSQQRRLGGG